MDSSIGVFYNVVENELLGNESFTNSVIKNIELLKEVYLFGIPRRTG